MAIARTDGTLLTLQGGGFEGGGFSYSRRPPPIETVVSNVVHVRPVAVRLCPTPSPPHAALRQAELDTSRGARSDLSGDQWGDNASRDSRGDPGTGRASLGRLRCASERGTA